MENENQKNESLTPETLAPINLETVVQEETTNQEPEISVIEMPIIEPVESSTEQEMPEIVIPDENSKVETPVANTDNLVMPENNAISESANSEENITPEPNLTVDTDSYQASTLAPETLQPEPVLAPEPLPVNATPEGPVNDAPNATLPLQNQTAKEEPIKEEPTKPKKSKKGLLIVLIILVLLIAGATFAYFKFLNLDSSGIYSKLINKYTATSENFLKQNVSKMDNTFVSSGNLKIDSNIDGLSQLKNFSLNYSLGASMSNSQMEASINLNENNNSLIDATLYIVKNKLYLNSNDISDNMLLISDLGESFNFEEISGNFKASDSENVIKGFNNALEIALQKASYSTTKSEINVNGKKVKVNDNIMIINESNYNIIITTFLNQVKNNSQMIESLANLTYTSQDEIKATIDDLLKQDYSNIDPFKIRIDVYTKPLFNDVVGIDAFINDDKILAVTKNSSKNEETYDVTILNNGEKLATGKLISNKDDKITINTTIGDMTVNISIQCKTNKDGISSNIEATFTNGDEYLTINYDSNINYNQALSNVDVSKAVDINDLSEEEYQNISYKLDDILANSGLYDIMYNVENINYPNDINYLDNEDTSDDTDTVPDACRYATCNNCSGDKCTCTYTDTSFKQNTVICPK